MHGISMISTIVQNILPSRVTTLLDAGSSIFISVVSSHDLCYPALPHRCVAFCSHHLEIHGHPVALRLVDLPSYHLFVHHRLYHHLDLLRARYHRPIRHHVDRGHLRDPCRRVVQIHAPDLSHAPYLCHLLLLPSSLDPAPDLALCLDVAPAQALSHHLCDPYDHLLQRDHLQEDHAYGPGLFRLQELRVLHLDFDLTREGFSNLYDYGVQNAHVSLQYDRLGHVRQLAVHHL